MNDSGTRGKGWLWLLLLPFIGTLWPPFYASSGPQLAGFPFFYWYLFLWIILVAIITAVVYGVTRS